MKLNNQQPLPSLFPKNAPKPADISISLDSSKQQVYGRGHAGPDVERLQKDLVAMGYPVAVDGKYGPETETAVKKFQHDHGLKEDGVMGPETRAAISAEGFKAIQKAAVPPRPDLRFGDGFDKGSSGGGNGGGGGAGW